MDDNDNDHDNDNKEKNNNNNNSFIFGSPAFCHATCTMSSLQYVYKHTGKGTIPMQEKGKKPFFFPSFKTRRRGVDKNCIERRSLILLQETEMGLLTFDLIKNSRQHST